MGVFFGEGVVDKQMREFSLMKKQLMEKQMGDWTLEFPLVKEQLMEKQIGDWTLEFSLVLLKSSRKKKLPKHVLVRKIPVGVAELMLESKLV